MSILQTLRQFVDDLLSPSYYVRHQMARKQVFMLLSLLVGIFTGISMYYYGFSLAVVALGSAGSLLATAVSSILGFTDERSNFAKFIDDKINPPIAVTIKLSENDIERRNWHQARLALIQETLLSIRSSESIPISRLKENLKRLFKLRSYTTMSHTDLDRLETQFNQNYTNFMKNIKTEADWGLPKNTKQLKSLIVEAVFYSDAVLARMEQEMREAKVAVSTENVAKWLKNQEKRYCRDFLYSGVIDLYHSAKSKLRVIKNEENEEQLLLSREKDKGYYEAKTDKYVLRKIYNTFIKDGFYQRYGNKAFRYALLKEDGRFEHWTQRDSKKKRTFEPFPDTRPT